MEENVALDSSKQKKFVKSVKGIKQLIKKNEGKTTGLTKVSEIKDGKVQKKKRKEKGLVYLSHIPHGFYEHEMTQYFKQFGMVTSVRVIRSKKTGNSKGFAFVEFRDPAVGQIVADTMNNYLMGKRLIKAEYIPPEKQRTAFKKPWSTAHNPGSEFRLKMKKAHNANKDEMGNLQTARKLLSNVNKTKKKLSEMGINYDFFTPVDIPEVILNEIKSKAENKSINVNEVKSKAEKKAVKSVSEMKPKKGKIVTNVNEKKIKKEKNTNVQEKKIKKEKNTNVQKTSRNVIKVRKAK